MKTDIFELELFIAKFLRAGVIVSGLFMLTGWLGTLDLHHNIFLNYQNYTHNSLLSTISQYDVSSWPHLMIYLGLICLILLPLLRVLLTGLIFMKQRDYIMASLVLLVLAGLIISISQGIEI